MRQLQSLGFSGVPSSTVPSPIADAMIAPIKYEALNREVKVDRSFGWPSSPIKAEPAMMHVTIPKPRTMRLKIYIPTLNKYQFMKARNAKSFRGCCHTYDFEQILGEERQRS